jgi:hypothetical protein
MWMKLADGKRKHPSKEQEDLATENRKLRMLKGAVDTARALILQADLTIDEALDIVNATKRRALTLFPDKGETYDLIYAPRLFRALEERFGRDKTRGFGEPSGDRHRE